METMPQLSSSPLQECTEDGAPSEEEEFVKFRECSSDTDDSHVFPRDSASRVSSALLPDPCQCSPCIDQPVEKSQPTSTVSLKTIDDQAPTKAGLSENTSVLKSCFLQNETNFADFSVFGEQAAQAWCCGLGGAQLWDGEGIASQNKISISSGEVAILDSEPKTYLSKDNTCTKFYHCEKQSKLSQDCLRSFPMQWNNYVDKSVGNSCESHKERKHSFNLNFLRTSKGTGQREEKEKNEKSVSTLTQSTSLHDFVDNASCDEDSSQDEPSEDFEPNVSSLASQEETDTDQDQTDDEEELRNYRLSRSFCNDYLWYSQQTFNSDLDTGLFDPDHSTAQESSATSVNSECEKHPEEDHVFRGLILEPHMSQLQLVEGEGQGCLPPSDSFADFCSAASQEDRDCELFQDQQETFGQQCCQIVLHCQVPQLFLDSFPQLVPLKEVEDAVYGLEALLFIKDPNYHKEEEQRNSGLLCVPPGIMWPSQDILSVAGLQFQWAGSHINRCLHQCLGVDSKNFFYIGIKKQQVFVPALATNQELLESMKDSAVHFQGQTAVTPHAPVRT